MRCTGPELAAAEAATRAGHRKLSCARFVHVCHVRGRQEAAPHTGLRPFRSRRVGSSGEEVVRSGGGRGTQGSMRILRAESGRCWSAHVAALVDHNKAPLFDSNGDESDESDYSEQESSEESATPSPSYVEAV